MKFVEEEVERRCTQYYVQWLATFVLFLLLLQIGLWSGWASPNIARLQLEDSPFHLTPTEITFLISCTMIGAAIGSIIGSISLGYMGSRKTVLLSLITMGISWICLLMADSSDWMFANRLFGGVASSTTYCSFALYIAEISQPKIRGTLISIATLGSPIGMVLGIIIETYLPMEVTSSIYLVLTAIGILLLFLLRDTPYYLLSLGHYRMAENSIMFYRPDCTLEEEMKKIQGFIEKTDCQGITDKIREFKNPVIRKSMILVIIIFGLPLMSGFVVLQSYMQTILDSAKFDAIKPEEGVIYINMIFVISSILSMNLIDKLGRRFLLIFSSIGVTTALIALGVHFQLITYGVDPKTMQWLPIGSLILYIIAYGAGFNSVPSTVLSEIFPENMKSTAGFLATLSLSFFGFIMSVIYQPIMDSFGAQYAFWCFATIFMIGLTVTLALLPETKGKSVQEIQELLTDKK